ncbi:MAG TPA: phospholipase D-like domain-containing protein [Methylomirabilota bacterium]
MSRSPRPPALDGRPDLVVRRVPLPLGGERVEARDFLGRLRVQEAPDGTALRYAYDLAGRLRRVTHSSGAWVEYAQDDDAREWRARTSRTETIVRLTADGMPLHVVQRVDGHEWTLDYRAGRNGWPEVAAGPGGDGLAEHVQIDTDAARRRTTVRFSSGARTIEQLTPGRRLRPASVTLAGAAGDERAVEFEYDDPARLARAGGRAARYDEAGRLRAWGAAWTCDHDAQGRRTRSEVHGRATEYAHRGWAVSETRSGGWRVSYEYDPLGRRQRRRDADGDTRYAYDLFGQLAVVTLPDGRRVEYLYDGFGRLVGRAVDGRARYYVVGIDGHRRAEADEGGRVAATYLWLGAQCLARVAGGQLEQTYHRIHAGLLAGIGDGAGAIRDVPGDDPFGAAIEDGVPGLASLFGDPLTGLVHAGTRWLDPALGQFVTPDTWFGTEPSEVIPRELRAVFERMPGGTGRAITERTAYAWCAGDPVNFTDPTGHNWLGVIWSMISAFLWGAQTNSLALQMELANIAVDPIRFFIGLFGPGLDWYWKNSVFNISGPVGSYRLMTGALVLNGISRAVADAVWCFGNVIWAQPDDWEVAGDRDVVIAPGVSSFLAAAAAAAPNAMLVRNPRAKARGTVASRLVVDNVAWDPADATPIDSGLRPGDAVAISRAGGDLDEIRRVDSVTGTKLDLGLPLLPPEYVGQAVEVTRLDPGLVRLERSGEVLGQTITFVRGEAVHLPRQVPDGFPKERLIVKELLRARAHSDGSSGDLNGELIVLRVNESESNAGFKISDFVRIQRGDLYLGRRVVRPRVAREIVIEPALPPDKGPTVGLEVVTLTPTGISALAQQAADRPADTAAGREAAGRARVGLGDIRVGAAKAGRPLRKLDGLEISATAGKERRIVRDFWLQVPVHPVPETLRGVDVKLEVLTTETSPVATGTMEGGTGRTVLTTAAEAARFKAAQPVRVRTTAAPTAEAFTILAPGEGPRLQLDEPLPQPAFAAGVAVEVHPVTVVRTHDAERVVAPGDRIVIPAPEGTEVSTGSVVRVRTADSKDAPRHAVLRKIAAAPTALAGFDEPLPASHVADLAVSHFIPDDTTRRRRVEAPDVRTTLTTPEVALYAPGRLIHIRSPRGAKEHETCGEVERIDGTTIHLKEPVEGFKGPVVFLEPVEPTGKEARDGRLAGGTVLVPADPSVELTRREAIQHHELRHAWQAAVWGPFLLSAPIPWLTHLGFAVFSTRLASRESEVFRNFPLSTGFLDTLFTAMWWGLSGAEPVTKLDGQVGADRKAVTFAESADPALVQKFAPDRRITVRRGDHQALNYVDALDAAARRVTLRFALDTEDEIAAPGDTIELSMSPFENIRQTINTWFSLNLEQLWAPHIATTWKRVLSNFLNRDSWLPPFGVYPLAWIIADRERKRVYAEQDAAFVSGSLYTTIVVSRPSRIFVGQFSRLFAFIEAEKGGLSAAGTPVITLTVALPDEDETDSPATIAARVHGAVLVPGTGTVRFREHRVIPMKERAANVVGVFFSTAHPGTYELEAPGTLDKPVVFKYPFFGVDFDQLKRVEVEALDVKPRPGDAFYETETVEFTIEGDAAAAYEMRFRPGSVDNVGVLTGRKYEVPRLPPGTGRRAQVVQIIARYRADNPIFRGPGQLDQTLLRPEDLVNLCEEHTLSLNELVAPVIDPVAAGTVRDFTVPIAPQEVRVTSAMPPGASVNARIVNGTGRPARMKFTAPDRVTAPTPVTFNLVFGADPTTQKTVPVTVTVEPAPAAAPPDAPFLPAVVSDDYLRYVQASTHGLVRLLVNGRSSGGAGPDADRTEPLDQMEAVVKSLGAGDFVYLAAWFFEPATPLTAGGVPGATTWGELFAKKAREGTKVRIILNDFDPTSGFDGWLQGAALAPLDASIAAMPAPERDNYKYLVSLHPAHAGTLKTLAAGQGGRNVYLAGHHQTFMVARRGDEMSAFCGGVDIESRRTPARWSPTGLMGWHDLHVVLEGPITRDLEREFVMRWNREKGASRRAARPGWKAHETLERTPLGATDNTPAKTPHRVQMSRTLGVDSPFGPYATERDDVAEVYRRVIATATSHLYLESQSFRSPRLADAIVRQGRARRDLIVIVVLTAAEAFDDVKDPIRRHGDHLQFETLETLAAGLGARARFFTLANRAVHSKLLMVDDRMMTLGSANASVRSFELDSELNVSVADPVLVTGFRRRLWAHNLGVPEGTIAGWSAAEFIPRWDAVAAANAPRALDLMDGEGVVRFDHTANRGVRHTTLPDALARLDLASPGLLFAGPIPAGQRTIRLA